MIGVVIREFEKKGKSGEGFKLKLEKLPNAPFTRRRT
jgi:hypothetical protein